MAAVVGIGGARRYASAALAVDGRLVAACREESITRTRAVGSSGGRLPAKAIDTVLQLGNVSETSVSTYVAGEPAFSLPSHGLHIDHHHAHAVSAFYTSGFDNATVLVCDRHPHRELSVWSATPAGLRRLDVDWHGPAFVTLYSQATQAFGFCAQRDEHKFEALARTGQPEDRFTRLVSFRHDHLEVSPRFQSDLHTWPGSRAGWSGNHGCLDMGASRRVPCPRMGPRT